MIKVNFFGVLRLDYKVSSMDVECSKNVTELLERISSQKSIPIDRLISCSFYINGKPATIRSRVFDGDEVMVMSPVAGG
ncbi:MAG: MoaD/ThiS family protein [Clostridiales bacterium]|nr:MoaD/ThiS family protein [Clostridiales bacterium]